MTKHQTLRAVALASVCLAPLAAAAQSFDLGNQSAPAASPARELSGDVDVGVRYQSGTSPLFGRYTGNSSKGFSSLGGFDVEGGDTHDSGGTLFYRASGRNLNFGPDQLGENNSVAPEAELNFDVGQQGTWKAHAYYDAITYVGQSFLSPYDSNGALAPGLTAFGGATATRAGSIGTTYYLTHTLPEFQETAGTRRDIGGADGKVIIGEWTLTSGLRHEHKEGTILQTMDAAYGGTAFPEPVNYDTDRFDLKAEYATRRLQAQLGYTYSRFTDNNTAFNATYYSSGSATTAYQLTSQYTLPPSNDAHYLTAITGYNVTPTTRVVGDFRFGVEASSEPIGYGLGTPVSSLGSGYGYSSLMNNPANSGQLARVYNGKLQVTSRPLNDLDLLASYGIDGREMGSSPTTLYETRLDAGLAASNTYTVQSQSWTKQKVGLEAGYKILSGTKLTLGYNLDDVHRDAGDAVGNRDAVGYWVGHSTENTVSAKLAVKPLDRLNGSVIYEHGVRTGTFEFVAGDVASGFSGAYYQAPRTADRVKMRADYQPVDEWTFGVNGKLEANRYHYLSGQTGTERDQNASIGPDITFAPNNAISLHTFYTYQEVFYSNQGNGYTSILNGGWGFNSSTTDSIHTAGLSADWKVTDRLKLGTEYTFSYGDIAYALFDGGLTSTSPTAASYYNIQNLPTVSSSMHTLKVHADYKLTDNVSLMAGYGFDLYKDNDWAYGWNPVVIQSGSTVNLNSAEAQNSYRVHTVYTSMRVKF